MDSAETPNPPSPSEKRKAYKGVAMEGLIAKWYARTQRNDMQQYTSWAKLASGQLSEGSNVLEVAPGPGYLSIELARLGAYRVVGLDISKTFVDIASKNAREANVKVEFHQGDAAHMPFSDGTFDFAICTSAFKNFPDPTRVLDEVFRVLGPRGKAVIIDMRKEATKAELDEYVNNMRLGLVNSFVTRFTFRGLLKSSYTKDQICDIVAKSNFRTCETVDEGIGREIWLRKS